MKSGTDGNCSNCHGQMGSASGSYSWLSGRGYSASVLTDPNQSCLSWYGGNMAPGGPQNAQAVTDMNAWAKAGGLNN